MPSDDMSAPSPRQCFSVSGSHDGSVPAAARAQPAASRNKRMAKHVARDGIHVNRNCYLRTNFTYYFRPLLDTLPHLVDPLTGTSLRATGARLTR